MVDKKVNEHLINIVKNCIDGYRCLNDNNGVQKRLEYIMGQAIRQYCIAEENMHVSKMAKQVWDEIVNLNAPENKGFNFYNYKESIKLKDNLNISIPTFKGSNRKDIDWLDLNNRSFICFNELFVVEHTTPVSEIKAFLLNESFTDTSVENIKSVLEKMHVTRMLRVEDRRIRACSSRIKNFPDHKIDLLKDTSKDIFDKLVSHYYSQNLISIIDEKNIKPYWPSWIKQALLTDKIEIS